MRIWTQITVSLAAALVCGVSSLAWAQPDLSGNVVINEDDGFPGVCTAPCFSIEKQFDVFFAGNPSAPGVCGAGENTYVYTVTHLGPANPIFAPFTGAAVTRFELQVAFSAVASAGSLVPSTGITPSLATVNPLNVVTWDFQNPPIDVGQSSDQLFICSTLLPGTLADTMISAGALAALDAPGECIGPFVEPTACALEIDKTCCIPPPPSPGVDQCDGKVLSMVFEYLDDDCSATTNPQEGAAECSGGAPGDPVDVVITKDEDKIAVDGVIGGTGTFTVGDTFTIDNQEHADQGHMHELKSETKLRLDGPDDSQSLAIHTSCSKALSCGDQFGSLKLVELETTEGGIINCQTPDESATMCEPEGSPAGTQCTERPVEIVFEYTGEDCQSPLPQDPDKAECSGDPMDAQPVTIAYVGKDPDKIGTSPSAGILLNDEVRLTATGRDELHSASTLLISDAGGTLQTIELHTSCSQPLALGDEFGALKIVEFTQKDGQVFSLQDPSAPIFFDACEIPAAPPQPHCTSKILDLQLRYVDNEGGFGCNVSNSQEGKASCVGVDDTGEPVSVTITKDADKVSASPDAGIEAGDLVSIAKIDGELGSSTEFDVTGPLGTQSIMLHTSCSKPLNLGDRFGSFEVFGINRKDDGFISLGGVVEYQYKVTNPNANQVDNVVVDDDVFGPVAGPISLAANSMETFFVKQTIEEETTNTATVTGDVGGSVCTEDEDTVIVTVADPLPGPFDCSDAKPIDQLTMSWDGVGNILVVAHDGDADDAVLLTQDNVTPGTEIAVSGMGGSPNDQVWEIFAAGADPNVDTPIGESKFHISCSDDNMNGSEDCFKRQGDGKSDDAGLINDWLLEGMSGDQTLDCTP